MPQLGLEFFSDRDSRFISNFTREVCRLLTVKQGMSTAFHPQTDSQKERVHRILEDMLRHYVNPFRTDWGEHLDLAQFAVNDAWQESLQETPFMLNYRQHPLTFLSLQTHSQLISLRVCSRVLHVPRAVWSVLSKGRKPMLTGVIGMSR